MNLVGGSAIYSKGEVWVSRGTTDLNGKTITAWVYAPTGAMGDPKHKNGFQLFVKNGETQGFPSEYGCWYTIENENEWFPVELTVSESSTDCANGSTFVSDGFDPTKVTIIGLKMGAGDGSIASYEGTILLDAVDWN